MTRKPVIVNVSGSTMSQKKARIQMTMSLPAIVEKSGTWYVAECPILDVASQGEDEHAAIRNLVDALIGFFVSCFERGTLDEVLRESGFRPASGNLPPVDMPENAIPIEVSIPFFVQPLPECRA